MNLARPKREYLCELRCQCKGSGVADLVAKIRRQEVRLPRGLKDLEDLHQKNWRAGNLLYSDVIAFPQAVVVGDVTFEDIFDNGLEHWLLCYSASSQQAFLYNMTAQPRLIGSVECSQAWLLPGLIVTAHESGWCTVFDVARVRRDAVDDFELRPKSAIDATRLKKLTLVSNASCSILAGLESKKAGSGWVAEFLHVWDARNGDKIGKHALWRNDGSRPISIFPIAIATGEYPYLVVTMTRFVSNRMQTQMSLLNAFTGNVSPTDDFTLVGDYTGNESVYMHGKYVLFETSNHNFALIQFGNDGELGRLIFKAEDLEFVWSKVVFDGRTLLILSVKNIIGGTAMHARVLSVKGDTVSEQNVFRIPQVNHEDCLRWDPFVAFIDRDVFFCTNRNGLKWTATSLDGQELCSRVFRRYQLMKPVKVPRSSRIQPNRKIVILQEH